MAYFNGSGGYYWLGNYVPLVKTTRVYCDECAEDAIPFPPLEQGPPAPDDTIFHGIEARNGGQRHWNTGFRWTPCYGGDARCMVCGKPA
jgi:hypothetical protein